MNMRPTPAIGGLRVHQHELRAVYRVDAGVTVHVGKVSEADGSGTVRCPICGAQAAYDHAREERERQRAIAREHSSR